MLVRCLGEIQAATHEVSESQPEFNGSVVTLYERVENRCNNPFFLVLNYYTIIIMILI